MARAVVKLRAWCDVVFRGERCVFSRLIGGVVVIHR